MAMVVGATVAVDLVVVEVREGKGGRGGMTPRGSRGGGMNGGSKAVVVAHKHPGVFISKSKEDALYTKNMVSGEYVYREKRASVQAKAVAVLESVLHLEKWAAYKKALADRKKALESRKIIFTRSKQYAQEYDTQEKELVQLKHEARLKGGGSM